MYKYKPLLTSSVLRAMESGPAASHERAVRHTFEPRAVTISEGDCGEVLLDYAANTFDAVVTDPPYGLGRYKPEHYLATIQAWANGKDANNSHRKGIQNAKWDGGVPGPVIWKEVHRVLKPGAYLAAFGSPSTFELLVVALKLAGFEVLHTLPWVHARGWNIAANLGLAVQKAAKKASNDNTPDVVNGTKRMGNTNGECFTKHGRRDKRKYIDKEVIEITHPIGQTWVGALTHMRSDHEQIVIARKRSDKRSVAVNILTYGVGGMNVRACGTGAKMASTLLPEFERDFPEGVYCDKSDMHEGDLFTSEGQPNSHECLKPISLMRWLSKLVCPKGGMILDPFAGSGTGGIAALLESYGYLGIEKEARFASVARRRIANCKDQLDSELSDQRSA